MVCVARVAALSKKNFINKVFAELFSKSDIFPLNFFKKRHIPSKLFSKSDISPLNFFHKTTILHAPFSIKKTTSTPLFTEAFFFKKITVTY